MQRPQEAPSPPNPRHEGLDSHQPHSCSIPALGSQPEMEGQDLGGRRPETRQGWRPPCKESSWVPTRPALPTLKKSLIFRSGCSLGWVPSSSLPLRSRMQFRGQLGATLASVLISVLPLIGPTTPNLNFLTCETGLGHEDKEKFWSQSASSGCGPHHGLIVCRSLPSLSPSPAPPDAAGSLLLRSMGRLSFSSATSREKGGGGPGARSPLRALGPQKGEQLQGTHKSHPPLVYSGHRL